MCLLAWPKAILKTGLEVLSLTALAWLAWPEVLRETGLKFSTGLDVGTWPIDRLELAATSGTARLCHTKGNYSTNFEMYALSNK